MHGHAPILKMRIDGVRPSIVFLNDFRDPSADDWHNPGKGYGQSWAPDHATVQIDPKDRIEALDFRFLKGLRVAAMSLNENRARAILEACKRAGAQTIVASHSIQINECRFKAGWMEVYTNG